MRLCKIDSGSAGAFWRQIDISALALRHHKIDGATMTETTTAPTTAQKHNESEIYDRQIRLWGAEAQVCQEMGREMSHY